MVGAAARLIDHAPVVRGRADAEVHRAEGLPVDVPVTLWVAVAADQAVSVAIRRAEAHRPGVHRCGKRRRPNHGVHGHGSPVGAGALVAAGDRNQRLGAWVRDGVAHSFRVAAESTTRSAVRPRQGDLEASLGEVNARDVRRAAPRRRVVRPVCSVQVSAEVGVCAVPRQRPPATVGRHVAIDVDGVAIQCRVDGVDPVANRPTGPEDLRTAGFRRTGCMSHGGRS